MKRIYKLKQKITKNNSIDVYWVLEKTDIPKGLEFVPDPKDPNHYLLRVTETMPVHQLVAKLAWVADRMNVIRCGEKSL
ncbi:MAG TPA: hypothetical protein VLE50_07215 [Cellvibrio sp.]|nr:hypothetical protein [Cellvibrio sp.]